MKILSTFKDLSTITSSGEAAGYPAANVDDENPGAIWQADAYAGDVWLKMDFGAAASLTAAFFNRANFPACTIQGNATDVWTSPSFSQAAALVQDEAGNRKGWFDLTTFNYRYLRILIASGQTLDNGGTVPQLGNLIVGAAADLPVATEFDPGIERNVEEFISDGGNLTGNPRGIMRHVLGITFGDTHANMLALAKTWDHAVIFADLGSAAGSWLVIAPRQWPRAIRWASESTMRVTFKERT